MTKSKWREHFKLSDTLAAAQLGTRLTHDIMEVTEQLHLSILQRIPPRQQNKLKWLEHSTRLIYSGIKLAPRLSEKLLTGLARTLPVSASAIESPARRKAIAAINGVIGDQLQATSNPLATHTEIFHWDEQAQHQLVFLHGLCMDEHAWSHEQCSALASQMGASACFVRYNSGLSLADNGHLLANSLAQKLRPGRTLSLIGHSMGGLVAHAALHYAQTNQYSWHTQIRHLITVGSPHAGAPLAKLGHWSEERLAANPFTRPFIRLSSQRSAGIRDLQHGFLPVHETPCPCFCMAGQISNRELKLPQTLGDGLVTTASALALVEPEARYIIDNCHHLDLLKREEVFKQLETWLE